MRRSRDGDDASGRYGRHIRTFRTARGASASSFRATSTAATSAAATTAGLCGLSETPNSARIARVFDSFTSFRFILTWRRGAVLVSKQSLALPLSQPGHGWRPFVTGVPTPGPKCPGVLAKVPGVAEKSWSPPLRGAGEYGIICAHEGSSYTGRRHIRRQDAGGTQGEGRGVSPVEGCRCACRAGRRWPRSLWNIESGAWLATPLARLRPTNTYCGRSRAHTPSSSKMEQSEMPSRGRPPGFGSRQSAQLDMKQ